MTRLCTGLTVVGGTALICGLAAGLVGEVSRLTGGRPSPPIVAAAEVLVSAGLMCGAALLGAAAVWRNAVRRQPPQRQANFAAGPLRRQHTEPPPGLIGTPEPLAWPQAPCYPPAPPNPAPPGVANRAPEVAHHPPQDQG